MLGSLDFFIHINATSILGPGTARVAMSDRCHRHGAGGGV